MIEVIAMLIDVALIVVFIITFFDLIRIRQQIHKYRNELEQRYNEVFLENVRTTSNTGRVPSNDSVDASVHRCNICGDDMWRSRDCLHWPGVTYIVEEEGSDKRREIKCVPVIENAEETQEEKKAHV